MQNTAGKQRYIIQQVLYFSLTTMLFRYQLAIDSLTLALSREFNRPTDVSFRPQTPLVYGTYQAYLRRGLPHLKLALAEAKREGYMLGVKLVRGAYQELEVGVWNRTKVRESENGAVPPVWTSKDESDETFDEVCSPSLPRDHSGAGTRC
jgi:proline dehydrogenase